jgi:hypothetical protein
MREIADQRLSWHQDVLPWNRGDVGQMKIFFLV